METGDSLWVVPGYVTRTQTGLKVRYEYVVAGQRYESNRVSPFDQFGVFIAKGEEYNALADRICEAKKEGGTITALYNPAQPKKSILTIALPLPFLLALILGFAVFAGMALMMQALQDFRQAHPHIRNSRTSSMYGPVPLHVKDVSYVRESRH